MQLPLETLKGNIDFAILTIREDECGAVLDRFKPSDHVEGQRRYEVGEITTDSGQKLRFVVARCVKQGEGEAQRLTEYLIQDLDPSLFVLVGIGGSVPSKDFTLGDVVCATQVQDFCVRAVKEGGASTFNVGGGEMHGTILSLLGSLPQILRNLPEWNTSAMIGCEPPAVEALTPRKTSLLYGSPQWRKEVCECVAHHFADGKRVKAPTATARPVASSDTLVKDTETIQTWQTDARAVAAVEMELAGVYTAARKPYKEYPILAVRGISDIVGLRRDDGWTAYACHTAAAFTYAFFRAGVADGLLTTADAGRPPRSDPPTRTQSEVASPVQTGYLPVPATDVFVGRENQLRDLTNLWQRREACVVQIVADGGTGKTTLVRRWLDSLGPTAMHEPPLQWSFYSQGSHRVAVDSTAFFNETARSLGLDLTTLDPDSRKQIGKVIAQRFAHRGGILILDGVETLQHPPDVDSGAVHDQQLDDMLRQFREYARVGRSAGHFLVVLTTRWAVPRLGNDHIVTMELPPLSPDEGAKLLRSVRVLGTPPDTGYLNLWRVRRTLIVLLGIFRHPVHPLWPNIQFTCLAAIRSLTWPGQVQWLVRH